MAEYENSFLSARMALVLNGKQRQGLHVLHEADCIILQGYQRDVYPIYMALAGDAEMQQRHTLEYVEKYNQIVIRFREYQGEVRCG